MTRKLLEAYSSNKRLVERCAMKISNEQLRDIPIVAGKVKGSSRDFPYIEQHFNVHMDDPIEAEKQYARIKTYKKDIEQAEREMAEVELFVRGILDVKNREIFTYRYIDGMKATEVAKKVGYTKGRISQIIGDYLKD